MVLVAEEHHLVSEEGGTDLGDRAGVEIAGQFHAVDAGADTATELGHGEGHVDPLHWPRRCSQLTTCDMG